MFTSEELLVIKDALRIADEEYIRSIEANKNTKICQLHITESKRNYGQFKIS